MASLLFEFRSDAELEDLIASIWIELERTQTPSPKLRLGGEGKGRPFLELHFGTDEHAQALNRMLKLARRPEQPRPVFRVERVGKEHGRESPSSRRTRILVA